VDTDELLLVDVGIALIDSIARTAVGDKMLCCRCDVPIVSSPK
jgi:hypothetical protein